MDQPVKAAWACLLIVFVTACGGGGGSSSPPPADDSGDDPPPANTFDVTASLESRQVVGTRDTAGSGNVSLTIDEDNGDLTGSVSIDNVSADSVSLNSGFAGENGPVLVTFDQDNDTQWSPPPDANLSETDLDTLAAGGLYVEATTPDGAVRGQLIIGEIDLFFSKLTDRQEVPPLETAASGTLAMTFDPDTNGIVAHVNTTGVDDADAAHIHEAVAGVNGPVLIGLMQDNEEPGHWMTPDDAELDADGLAALMNADLYINVHTPEHPGGEIRGQIVPEGIEVLLVELSGDEEVPPVDTNASGVGAVTVNLDSSAIRVHANTLGVDDATAAHVHEAPTGENGSVVIGLMQDPDDLGHWMTEDNTELSAELMTAYDAGDLYINVHTPEHTGGEIRGQIVPTRDEPSGVSFTTIQDDIFTPSCAVSGCHTGAAPPEGLNLSEGQAYDNIVDVASSQKPELMRIDPGNPDDSYLVRKVEGTAEVGDQMPQGGPPLSDSLIDQLRQWVSEGARADLENPDPSPQPGY